MSTTTTPPDNREVIVYHDFPFASEVVAVCHGLREFGFKINETHRGKLVNRHRQRFTYSKAIGSLFKFVTGSGKSLPCVPAALTRAVRVRFERENAS